MRLDRRGFLAVVLTLGLLLAFVPAPASAHHGLMQSDECGTYTYDADWTKGRRDSMVVKIHHTVGCFTYDYTNYVPAGYGEQQGNSWQMRTCDKHRYVAQAHFRFYRHIEIDPADVKVRCDRYPGSSHD
jgi:hypothetical protein